MYKNTNRVRQLHVLHAIQCLSSPLICRSFFLNYWCVLLTLLG